MLKIGIVRFVLHWLCCFSQVLMDLGYYMDDEQFKELCTMLKFTNGHMNYIDFVQNFEDPRIGEKHWLLHDIFHLFCVSLHALYFSKLVSFYSIVLSFVRWTAT